MAKSLKSLKNKAWTVFSTYIRQKFADSSDFVSCYTCGNKIHWKESQTGHWIEGHSNAVYINEDYVRPQCMRCNIFLKGNQGTFRDKIRQELGDERVDQLIIESKQVKILKSYDYEELIEHYSNLTKNIK